MSKCRGEPTPAVHTGMASTPHTAAGPNAIQVDLVEGFPPLFPKYSSGKHTITELHIGKNLWRSPTPCYSSSLQWAAAGARTAAQGRSSTAWPSPSVLLHLVVTVSADATTEVFLPTSKVSELCIPPLGMACRYFRAWKKSSGLTSSPGRPCGCAVRCDRL